MVTVSAPGKLFLSGEWAVLQVGNPGIVTAVNKRVFADVKKSGDEYIHITIDDFGITDVKAVFDGNVLSFEGDLPAQQQRELIFIKGAIETALNYLGVCRPFAIRSWGEMSQITVGGQTKKVGFGSSAAAVVATIAGVLAFNGVTISSRTTKDKIYKMAAMAHYFAQGKLGSAFDVAASTYGGIFVYQRFDPDWLMKEIEARKSVKEIVDANWKAFSVEELEIPDGFELLIGWTKEPASTSAMVKQMGEFQKQHHLEHARLYTQIADLVREEIMYWKKKDTARILSCLRKNEEYLRELGEKSGVPIETPELRKLSETANSAGAAGKLSGAGGGDCGIAISFDPTVSAQVRKKWREQGLYLIDATIDPDGVRVEQ